VRTQELVSFPVPAAGRCEIRVARSLRINLDMLDVSASAARTALKNSQLIRERGTKAMLVMGPDTKIKACVIGPSKTPAVFILFIDG
jgi:hypothetical protein